MLFDIEITQDLVFQKLNKLVSNKSPGVHNLVPKVLIETAMDISKSLSMIFRKSLEDGVVPDDWKRANVAAIYKTGSKNSASNYRPISLTCQVCKVLESIIRDKMLDHLNKFKIIKESQHGFVKNRSCLTNLLEFLAFVSENVDQGSPVDVIYLDFQKAFDKVPHKRLMLKVCGLGVDGKVGNWIESWLSNRE